MAEQKQAPAAASRPLLMIPGPTEFHPEVLAAIGEPSPSHVAPAFIEDFGATLGMWRQVLLSQTGQPFILSGSGTLGWDLIAANFVEPGERVLVVNTGYFSDSYGACLEAYGATVDHVRAPAVGDTVSIEQLSAALAQHKYKLVALTQVDTSTAVLNNIKTMAAEVRKQSPDTLISVDGVCSFGAEEFRFDEWHIDLAMTASQKALGVPPGLILLLASERAMKVRAERKSRVLGYYCDLHNWLPIMKAYEARQPSYFATPAVNLIKGMHVSLKKLLAVGPETLFARHRQAGAAFKAAMTALGLKQVPLQPTAAANTLSALRYPAGINGPAFLEKVKAHGIVIAGGLHRQIKAEYFRVGHMGVSADPASGHLLKTVQAIEAALLECGYDASYAGKGTQAFTDALKHANV